MNTTMPSFLTDYAIENSNGVVTLNMTEIMRDHARFLEDSLMVDAQMATAKAQKAIDGANFGYMIIVGVVAFLMQAGFALLESGTVRYKNH